MKKIIILPLLFLALLFAGGCKDKPADSSKEKGDSIIDSIQKVEEQVAPDTTLYGHIGEGTSMNVLEFITEQGDTMYLSRADEQGREGRILGDFRSPNDLLAITIDGLFTGNEAVIGTCINTTEMLGVWTSKDKRVSFYIDGSADNETHNYKNWKLVNGQLLVNVTTQTELGEMEHTDTLQINELTETSLKLTNRQGVTFVYGK